MRHIRFEYIIYLIFFLSFFSYSCDSEEPAPILKAPLALKATDIGQHQFTANWTNVIGGESYKLDVSKSSDFFDFIDGYQSKRITEKTENISGLEPSTNYYYRVKAISAKKESEYSNVVKVTTDIADVVSLKDAANEFYVGMIVQANRMTGSHDEIFKREFSSITAEYEMKMNIMYPSEGSFSWTASDAIVEYANSNGFNLHGHTLIWYKATPEWVENFTGTKAEFETMIEEYIKTTVTRYKGKVKSWDVVNEAFLDGSGEYRNSVFLEKLGSDYIAKCFTWAREADPDVLLFYNDYNMCSDKTKRDAVLAMVDDFKSRNIPIDGVGYQMHIAYNSPDKEKMTTAANEIVDRDLLLHFSELDIRANPNNNLTGLTDSRSLELKEKYKEVAEIYSALPAKNKYALTIWGLKDNESWLINFWGHTDWPLLYNADATEKDAYYGFLEGLLVK